MSPANPNNEPRSNPLEFIAFTPTYNGHFRYQGRNAMRYRRSRTDGGTYFFAVNLDDRTSTLLVDGVDTLRACVARVKRQHPFIIDA